MKGHAEKTNARIIVAVTAIAVFAPTVTLAQLPIHRCMIDGVLTIRNLPCESVSKADKLDCPESADTYQERIDEGSTSAVDRVCLETARERQHVEVINEMRERHAWENLGPEFVGPPVPPDFIEVDGSRYEPRTVSVATSDSEALAERTDRAARNCMTHVMATHSFKDPQSARLEGAGETGWALREGISTPFVWIRVNAKNSYGAYAGASLYRCWLSGGDYTTVLP